jgi:hypothetical protein
MQLAPEEKSDHPDGNQYRRIQKPLERAAPKPGSQANQKNQKRRDWMREVASPLLTAMDQAAVSFLRTISGTAG